MSDTSPREKLGWMSRRLRLRVLGTSLLLAFLCYAFFTWVLWPVKVTGDSMMPNYHNDSRHFINKLAYWSGKPRRGEVIGLRAGGGEIYIKRVVGLPGERVSFEDGRILINGQLLEEPYIDSKIPWTELEPVTLGPDDYYVIGDNRATSVLGPVPFDRFIGRVLF